MIKNYFRTAWRNLLNNKVYSAINILGLATGMAVALLIALWVYNEYSYNKFLPGHEQLYQVKRNFNSNGDILTFNTVSLKLADALRNDIPEIESVAETDWMGPHGLMAGDRKFYIGGAMAAADFLKMFRYPLLEGNADLVLKDPYSIVLTTSTAKILFGNENAMNKTVRVDNRYDLKVTGILEDLPHNSSFQFKYIIPFSYYEQTNSSVKEARNGSFGDNSFQLFIKLRPGASYAQVAAKIKDLEKTEDNSNAQNSEVILQPMKNWRLYSRYENGKEAGGYIEYVRIFSIIGALVLLIACINFINLATAKSEKRAREVGIRKAVGSARKQLILQFLIESSLTTIIAAVFSLLLVQLSLPAFNALTGSRITIPFSSSVFWSAMLFSVALTTLLAGSRPAFYLSSFNPVKVLKGSIHAGRSAAVSRKILVVIQFSCSIALIISTIVVYRQVQYAKNRPVGYHADRLMMTDLNDDLSKNYTALKNELLQSGIVTAVTSASSPATGIYWHSNVDSWPGKYPEETVEMGTIVAAADYFNTLGMQLQSGRDFTGNAKTDSADIILNEAAVKRLRLKEPLNQVITFHNRQVRIIGVAKNALMGSPYSPAEPTLFMCSPGDESFMIYRLSPAVNAHEAISTLTAIFTKYNVALPYDYRFVNEEYNRKFYQETLAGKLSGVFAGLAILISCLGLFGLASYIAERRTKEIGIRKVLGASISQVWLLLSKDFILLVTISCLIASPIALYLLHNWLQQYDYRITIGPDVFIISAVAALLITLLTISFQAIRAAVADPVKSLRSE